MNGEYSWLASKASILSEDRDRDPVVTDSEAAMAALDLWRDFQLGMFFFERVLEADAKTLDAHGEAALKTYADRAAAIASLRAGFTRILEGCRTLRPQERGYDLSSEHVEQLLTALDVMASGAAIWHPGDEERARVALEAGDVISPADFASALRTGIGH